MMQSLAEIFAVGLGEIPHFWVFDVNIYFKKKGIPFFALNFCKSQVIIIIECYIVKLYFPVTPYYGKFNV